MLPSSAALCAGGLYSWVSSLYSYNRDAWMTDVQLEQVHEYQKVNIEITRSCMNREEVRDLMQAKGKRIDNSILVTTLILALAGEMLIEGQVPTECPGFILNAYMLCLGSGIFYLVLAILFGVFASHEAYSNATTLLTETIRPPWLRYFKTLKQKRREECVKEFERRPVREVLKPPMARGLVTRVQGALGRAEDAPGKCSSGVHGNLGEDSHQRLMSPACGMVAACTERSASKLNSPPEPNDMGHSIDPRHWWVQESEQTVNPLVRTMTTCVLLGSRNLLEACGYYCLATLYGEYGKHAWAFSGIIQVVFIALHAGMIYFMSVHVPECPNAKRSEEHVGQEGSKGGERAAGGGYAETVKNRCCTAEAVAAVAAPIMCALAAWTSVPNLDRFFIPLCYLSHWLASGLLWLQTRRATPGSGNSGWRMAGIVASSFLCCSLVHHQREMEGEQPQLQDSSSPTHEPAPTSASSNARSISNLPQRMLDCGMQVLCLLWLSAVVWSLYISFNSLDLGNSNMWRQARWEPALGLAAPVLSSPVELRRPSPYFQPHALVCPQEGPSLLANKFSIFELIEEEAKLRPVPCNLNSSIADLAYSCVGGACSAQVLLTGTEADQHPTILDCRTGQQWPLLQTTEAVQRLAARTSREVMLTNGAQPDLFAAADHKVISYRFSLAQRNFLPEDVMLHTHKGKLKAIDLVEDKAADRKTDQLILFYDDGRVVSREMASGDKCGAWQLPTSEGGTVEAGCVYGNASSVRYLVRKGRSLQLMHAHLSHMGWCRGKAWSHTVNECARHGGRRGVRGCVRAPGG